MPADTRQPRGALGPAGGRAGRLWPTGRAVAIAGRKAGDGRRGADGGAVCGHLRARRVDHGHKPSDTATSSRGRRGGRMSYARLPGDPGLAAMPAEPSGMTAADLLIAAFRAMP